MEEIMGKFFNKQQEQKAKVDKERVNQLRKGNYIPWRSIESKVHNEQMIPTEIRERECYPDYVSDWARMNKTNQ